MKNPFVSILFLFLSILFGCQEEGTFSFYTQYSSRGNVVTERQKQELKDGKYFLEVKNYTWRKDQPDTLYRTKLYVIDADVLKTTHQLQLNSIFFSDFTSTMVLYPTSAKKFMVEEQETEVLRLRSAGTANNCCMSYDVHFWSPKLGLIFVDNINGFGDVITEMIPEQKEYSHKPAHFSRRESLTKLIRSDKEFYYHADSGQLQTYRQGKCIRPNIAVDDCSSILEIQQTAREILKYPNLPVPECFQGNIKTFVRSDREGKLCFSALYFPYTTIWDLEGYDKFFQEEVILALARLPQRIQPVTYEGIAANSVIDLSFQFSIPDSSKCREIFAKREEEQRKREADKIYEVVEEHPVFRGGGDDLEEYILQNLVFPPEADKSRKERKMILQFVVNPKGVPENIKVIRSFDDKKKELFEQEAIRLVKEMPKWKPGKMRGKRVRVYHTIRLDFSSVLNSPGTH